MAYLVDTGIMVNFTRGNGKAADYLDSFGGACLLCAMTIPARYENGVFKPLEDVKLTEGTKVEVHVPEESAPKRPKSVRDWPIFGMWADRDDIPDGVTYEDRIRRPRY